MCLFHYLLTVCITVMFCGGKLMFGSAFPGDSEERNLDISDGADEQSDRRIGTRRREGYVFENVGTHGQLGVVVEDRVYFDGAVKQTTTTDKSFSDEKETRTMHDQAYMSDHFSSRKKVRGSAKKDTSREEEESQDTNNYRPPSKHKPWQSHEQRQPIVEVTIGRELIRHTSPLNELSAGTTIGGDGDVRTVRSTAPNDLVSESSSKTDANSVVGDTVTETGVVYETSAGSEEVSVDTDESEENLTPGITSEMAKTDTIVRTIRSTDTEETPEETSSEISVSNSGVSVTDRTGYLATKTSSDTDASDSTMNGIFSEFTETGSVSTDPSGDPSVQNVTEVHAKTLSSVSTGRADTSTDNIYKKIGCFINHNAGAIQKATCPHLDGSDAQRNDPIGKCAICADVVKTYIFAVDKNNVCYAAKGNECSFDVYGKVPGSSRQCDPSLNDSHVTAYVLGSKFVKMHDDGIEIQSSIVCKEREPDVHLPTGSLSSLNAEEATGLLRLTVNKTDMKKLPDQQVKKIKNFLAEIAEKTVFTSNISHTHEFLGEYIGATANLLSSGYFDDSESKGRAIAASEVQATLETFMGKAAESLQTITAFSIKKGDIAVEVSSESAFGVMKKGARLPRIPDRLNGECRLPPSFFKELRETAFKGSETERPTFEPQYVSFVAISMDKGASNLPLKFEVEESNDTTVAMMTNVVTFSTSLRTPHHVAEPVAITLQHAKQERNDNKMNDSYTVETNCVFWNYSLSPETGGAWSRNGCWMNSTNSTHTVCHCNHLTSFAVLMKFTASVETLLVLDIVTYIGVCVSILSLLATFGIFVYLNDILHNERTTIHKNLMVAIGLGQLVFISGINVTNDKITCTVIAVLLHLFFLASFMWMLAEGIHLYAKVIYVFTGGRNLLPLFYTIGWGFPVIVVTVSAATRIDGYGTEDYCWLSLKDGLIWAFIGPAVCVIATNLVILVLVVRIVILASGGIPQTQDPKLTAQAWSAIKGIVILTPILGISWLFGFLAVNRDTLVFEFLFTFCNAFQGLFIFLFHCVGNSEVRSAFKRKREQISLTKEFQTSVPQSTPITGKSNKMAIPVIVMSQYEGSKEKLGSCISLGSNSCRAKVAPSYGQKDRSNQTGSVTSLSIINSVTSLKKVDISLDRQPYTEIEDDFESFDSIGASISSGGSLSKSIGYNEGDRDLTEVECPSHYIIKRSQNTRLSNFPFKIRPILHKRKQNDQY